jgi:pimeloyl-ACP methyl ester carboxylesterase
MGDYINESLEEGIGQRRKVEIVLVGHSQGGAAAAQVKEKKRDKRNTFLSSLSPTYHSPLSLFFFLF